MKNEVEKTDVAPEVADDDEPPPLLEPLLEPEPPDWLPEPLLPFWLPLLPPFPPWLPLLLLLVLVVVVVPLLLAPPLTLSLVVSLEPLGTVVSFPMLILGVVERVTVELAVALLVVVVVEFLASIRCWTASAKPEILRRGLMLLFANSTKPSFIEF